MLDKQVLFQPPGVHNSLVSSGWYANQFYSNLHEPDLTNSIHPIFQKENWINRNDPDFAKTYRAMSQPLRLASLLIEVALPFFHTIFFGRLILLNARNQDGGRDFELLDARSSLSAEQEKLTRGLLLDLALHVKLDAPHDSEDDGTTLGDYIKSHVHHGRASVINLRRQRYNNIATVRQRPIVDRLGEYMDMASVFVHELAHAAMLARIRDDVAAKHATLNHVSDKESTPIPISQSYALANCIFWEGEGFAEEGYQLERFLFGGSLCPVGYPTTSAPSQDCDVHAVNGRQYRRSHVWAIQDEPCQYTVDMYRTSNSSFGHRGGSLGVRRLWRLDYDWVSKLFDHASWELPFKQPTLYPPRTIGIRQDHTIDATGRIQLKVIRGRDRRGVPDGYIVLPGGLMLEQDSGIKYRDARGQDREA